MKLSIVTTLYRSADYIDEFFKRSASAAKSLVNDDYEVIFVDDGSPDDSLARARNLVDKEQRVLVVELSRNFGHHRALMTGLACSKGEFVFLLDSDLEEDPEWLLGFMDLLATTDADVVYGVQATRKGGFWERLSGALFWKLIRVFSGLNVPENAVTARLMKRSYVDALLMHREREIFFGGLCFITGFRQLGVPVNKGQDSPTTYSLRRKLSLLWTSVTAVSDLPLYLVFNLGLVITATAFFYSVYLVVNRLAFGGTVPGFASLMVSLWLIGGMLATFVGIIGIYVAKIFNEVKQRPVSIIRATYSSHENAE